MISGNATRSAQAAAAHWAHPRSIVRNLFNLRIHHVTQSRRVQKPPNPIALPPIQHFSLDEHLSNLHQALNPSTSAEIIESSLPLPKSTPFATPKAVHCPRNAGRQPYSEPPEDVVQCPPSDQRHHHQHEDFERMPTRVAVDIMNETFDLMNDTVDIAIAWTAAIM